MDLSANPPLYIIRSSKLSVSKKLIEKSNSEIGHKKLVSAAEIESENNLVHNRSIVLKNVWSRKGPRGNSGSSSVCSQQHLSSVPENQHKVLVKKRRLDVGLDKEKVDDAFGISDNSDGRSISVPENQHKVFVKKRRLDVGLDKKKDGSNARGNSDGRSISVDVHSRRVSASLSTKNGKCIAMNSPKSRQCAKVLQIIMDDPDGWPFNQPVDPVALRIPDYFSIITEPMDLGTIKKNLEREKYSNTDQFAADVMLTFSNAMRYNPPVNNIHNMAKRLNYIFKSKWDALKSQWWNTSSATLQPSLNDLEMQIPAVEEETERVHVVSEKSSTFVKTWNLGNDMTNNFKKQRCAGKKPPKHANLSEKSPTPAEKIKLRKDVVSNDSKEQRKSSLAPDVKLNPCHLNQLHPSTAGEFDPPCVQQQLSPTKDKDLRAAALKARFAGIIKKAQQNMLGEISNPATLQRETEKCEKKQQKEMLKTEPRLAAKNAVKLKAAELEKKSQMEREREAARLAMDKMECTVQLESWWEVSNDLHKLGCPVVQYDMHRGCEVRHKFGKLLNQCGYFLNDEDPDEVIDSWANAPGYDDTKERGERVYTFM